MAVEMTPEEIRRASFRTVLRGLDAGEVESFLNLVAERVESLLENQSRLEARMGDHADRDLESEFDLLGREVTAVLQAAREAAESMRERASLDAARWRSESMAESERLRKDARNDSEALRGDAWTTGTELLNQAAAEAKRAKEESESDVLSIMGSAEREAHRLISAARREAEDLLRAATMDAEKVTSDATRRRDEMIEQAHRQSSSAEERTRALEERRAELLDELENVRATLNRLEGTLEQRREDMNLSATDTPSVKVVPSGPAVPPAIENWEPGETVRIIAPGSDAEGSEAEAEPAPLSWPRRDRPESKQKPAEPAPAPEQREAASPPAEPKPAFEPEPVSEPEIAAAPEPEPPPAPATDASDVVSELFASLKGDGEKSPEPKADVPSPSPAEEPVTEEDPLASALRGSDEFLEERDARLLPIINRALRGVKKSVTDAQNVALDGLRTDGDWIPDPKDMADGLRADLIGLWTESFSAGHEAAETLVGKKMKRPETPATTAADEFGESLSGAVSEALLAAGDSQRDRQSAASRVFRGWRSHEAERWVRELAYKGYRLGIEKTASIDA
jgi:DivIVA domain-containing protein